MVRRTLTILLLAVFALGLVACSNKRVQNPIADLGSKQPDKILFDRSMEALKKNKFDVARMTLQTLINTYPDSEYVARAKLGIADSWYAEHTSSALAQAEIEYKDFMTFFPNMAEASEAQLKVANIHYEQMEKPDRDFTHAKRAEQEYRNLLMQYPDSPLSEQSKRRLLEVQEVLGEREFRIGRFYYLKQSYPAAIARLKSLVDAYPVYSGADEALFMLGDAYEGQINLTRQNRQLAEVFKARLIEEFTKQATDAYSHIITRYPVTDRVGDAKQRLIALKRPVPEPTPEAIAQNKAEEESRREMGRMAKLWSNFRKRPDTSRAVKVGEPVLDTPKQTDATEVVRQATQALIDESNKGSQAVTVETVGTGAPPPSQATPRSDAQAEQPAPPPGDNAKPAEQVEANDAQPAEQVQGNDTKPAEQVEANDAKPAEQVEVNDAKTAEQAEADATSDAKVTEGDYASSQKKKKKKKKD